MRANGGSISKGNAAAFFICVLLIALVAWGVRESRKAARGLGLWAISLDQMRRVGKYIYLFTLLLLVIRAFKGIWAVLEVLAGIILAIPMLIAIIRA